MICAKISQSQVTKKIPKWSAKYIQKYTYATQAYLFATSISAEGYTIYSTRRVNNLLRHTLVSNENHLTALFIRFVSSCSISIKNTLCSKKLSLKIRTLRFFNQCRVTRGRGILKYTKELCNTKDRAIQRAQKTNTSLSTLGLLIYYHAFAMDTHLRCPIIENDIKIKEIIEQKTKHENY